MNVNDYFDKQNIQVLTTEKTFDFITDISISEDKLEATLSSLLEQNTEDLKNMTIEQIRKRDMDDKVFQNVYIPRSLGEMSLEDLDKIHNRKY